MDYWHGIGTWYTGWEWAHTSRDGRQRDAAGRLPCRRRHSLVFRDEVVEVSAFGNNVKGLYEYHANVVAILKFRSGAIGKTSTLLDCEMPYAFNIDLAGTEGTLRDNRIWSKPLCPARPAGPPCPRSCPIPEPWTSSVRRRDEPPGGLHPDDQESHCNVADAYHTHESCMAIDRSMADGGRPVRLPLTSP